LLAAGWPWLLAGVVVLMVRVVLVATCCGVVVARLVVLQAAQTCFHAPGAAARMALESEFPGISGGMRCFGCRLTATAADRGRSTTGPINHGLGLA
jgi:hypothetical protein